jgi:hypothetical protein
MLDGAMQQSVLSRFKSLDWGGVTPEPLVLQ